MLLTIQCVPSDTLDFVLCSVTPF